VQAMRLVELAIFECYQDAVDSGAVPPPRAATCAAGQDSTSAPSASAKRRARKKKRGAAGARQPAEAGREEDEDEEDAAEAEEATEAAASGSPAAPVSPASEAQGVVEWAAPSGGGPSYGALWSNWFPSILRDGSAEWNWMVFQKRAGDADEGSAQQARQPVASGIRAFVRHTFVDVEGPSDGQVAAPKRRARSVFF